MSATFEIKINAIRTCTVGELTNVIKRVEFSVKGSQQGHTIELIQHVDLVDPQSDLFVPLSQVSESSVIQWVEDNFTKMDYCKTHIQELLNEDIATAALNKTPLPWTTAE